MQQRLSRSTAKNSGSSDTYIIGTAWEALERTYSGTELDWAFDTAGSFALIAQLGTAKGSSYWPPLDVVVPGLLDKVTHIFFKISVGEAREKDIYGIDVQLYLALPCNTRSH